MSRTPLSRSKGERSRSPGRFTHRRVSASGSCSGRRGNVLAVRNCCYVAVCSAARGASALTGRRETEAYRGGRPPTTCSLYIAAEMYIVLLSFIFIAKSPTRNVPIILYQWRSHGGGLGGTRPPTCPKDRLWDSSRSDEKLVRLGGYPPPSQNTSDAHQNTPFQG